MWFWIGVFILVVGAIAAALATWQNMTGQWWLKLLGSVGASVCAVLVLLVVFWIITGVWTTYTSEPATTQIVKETVVVEKTVEKVVKETVVVTKEVAMVITATPTPTVPATETPTVTPTATPLPTQSAVVIVNSNCRDGEVIGNERNLLDRTPVGLAENNVAIEVSWQPGNGFGGYNRFNLVVSALGTDFQVFLVKVATIHMTRYCGTLQEVENYLVQGPHVRSMQATAADNAGNMPNAEEIGVYSLDLPTGTLKALKAAPLGPSVAEVRKHIEVVRLAGLATTALPTPTVSGACLTATQITIVWNGSNPASVVINGPAIANFGFPADGLTQYRVYVPVGQSVNFTKVGGAYWQFAATCNDAGLRKQLTEQSGGLEIKTIAWFKSVGHAK